MRQIDLSRHGITVRDIRRNLPPAELYAEAIRDDPDCAIGDSGARIAYSGSKTGRSPKDKRIVRNATSERDVWWGSVNVPIDEGTFQIHQERAKDYLNTRPKLYCVEAFAGWAPDHRLKIRVICSRPYHALFMHTMLIRPAPDELAGFGEPDAVIYNAGRFPANQRTAGMTSKTSIDLCLETKELVILGTEYAGEMKKGVFTMLNYYAPKRGLLSMHCSATADRNSDASSLMFGLSGTGKTTLSADPKRQLVGDDEHCGSDSGIFNIEGGCYAKAIDLAPETEPEIFQALRFGAVLENVVYDEESHHVDFHDTSITQTTRGAYPIDFIRNAKIPCTAGHPTDIIFLTCDAFGVLPPVSVLSPQQAMYHFVSGYTAKVAGTEMGVSEPQATFSPCFGGPFLVWHPMKYAGLLAEKIRRYGVRVWLVNTGWSGGAYGSGHRMKLPLTRAIIDAIHSGALREAPLEIDSMFGLSAVTACPGVPSEVLVPRRAWPDGIAYDVMARKLAGLFAHNFRQFQDGVSGDVAAAGPCD
ncbi:MAG: phosphoenolpyruvate carboxykinase (ATP) [Planctomycetaceae bacterium]